MPSKRQTSKKRMNNVDSNSTNAGLKKKRTMKRGDGDVRATTSASMARRADNSRHPPIQRSSATIYSSEDEDDVNPSHPALTLDSLDQETGLSCTSRYAGCSLRR